MTTLWKKRYPPFKHLQLTELTLINMSGLLIQDINKHYALANEKIHVLRQLNVQIDPSELVVIMGPSGSGNTTLLNCISGIDQADSGSIQINNQAIDMQSAHQRIQLRRQSIGIVFQFFNLIPTLTVSENVALPFLINEQSNYQKKVEQILENVGLAQRKKHYPHQLSGGEMQLVSIARALVNEPPLLLADEPTGNVNPNIGRKIMDVLRDTAKQKNTSVLMVTHNPEHAAWADRICFLKDGYIQDELEQKGDISAVQPIHDHLLALAI